MKKTKRIYSVGTSHSYGRLVAVSQEKTVVGKSEFYNLLNESILQNKLPLDMVKQAILVANLKLGVSIGTDYFLIQDIKNPATPEPKEEKKEKKLKPMKIYVGKNKSDAKLMAFEDVLDIKLQRAGYDTDVGDGDEDSWVGAIQVTEKPSEVTTYFHFKDDEISKLTVWESPIKTIVDDDNMQKIS